MAAIFALSFFDADYTLHWSVRVGWTARPRSRPHVTPTPPNISRTPGPKRAKWCNRGVKGNVRSDVLLRLPGAIIWRLVSRRTRGRAITLRAVSWTCCRRRSVLSHFSLILRYCNYNTRTSRHILVPNCRFKLLKGNFLSPAYASRWFILFLMSLFYGVILVFLTKPTIFALHFCH